MRLITVKLKIPKVIDAISGKRFMPHRKETVPRLTVLKSLRETTYAISQNIQKKQLKVLFTL